MCHPEAECKRVVGVTRCQEPLWPVMASGLGARGGGGPGTVAFGDSGSDTDQLEHCRFHPQKCLKVTPGFTHQLLHQVVVVAQGDTPQEPGLHPHRPSSSLLSGLPLLLEDKGCNRVVSLSMHPPQLHPQVAQPQPLRNNQRHLYITLSTIYMTDIRDNIHMKTNWYIYPLHARRRLPRGPYGWRAAGVR